MAMQTDNLWVRMLAKAISNLTLPLTPSLSASDGERVSVGRVRGCERGAFTLISLNLIAHWNQRRLVIDLSNR